MKYFLLFQEDDGDWVLQSVHGTYTSAATVAEKTSRNFQIVEGKVVVEVNERLR